MLYPSAAAAIDAIVTGQFVTESNIAENGCLRCYLVINRGLLGLFGNAFFVDVSKFGAAGTGGGGVTSAAIISALGYTPADDATIHPRIMARMGMKL